MTMLGSANLTETGILSRTELGILIDDKNQVEELQRWFDGLWEQTSSPFIDETSALVAWLDEESQKSVSRRQKFALSPETRKVRAKLIRIEQRRDPLSFNGLSLDSVAQAILSRDDQHYTSLDKSLEKAIDKLAPAGFTLKDIFIEVRCRTPSATVREVYFLLVQHCANHPRSVFVEETVNRLVLSDGYFVQSDKDRLEESLRRFDQYLVSLIQELEFNGPKDLPLESGVEVVTGISERDQLVLVGELIDAGFLTIHDLPGAIPLYELSDDFDWTGRFHFFHRAKMVWSTLFSKANQPPQISPQEDDDFDDFDEALPSVFEEQRALRSAMAEESRRLALKAPSNAKSKVFSDGYSHFVLSNRVVDEANVRFIEWVMESPSGQRVIPVEKPGKFLARELTILPQLTSRFLSGNPDKRFAKTSSAGVDGVRSIMLKPINQKFVGDLPLTKAALEKYKLLETDNVLV